MDNKDLQPVLENFKPAMIPSGTNFWLVRTKGGRFYSDFRNNNFIALGWNLLSKKHIINNRDNRDKLKEEIQEKYNATKRSGYPLNQSETFIYDMKAGDYVIIPGYDYNHPILFGKLVEYYEDDELNYEEEKYFLDNLPSAFEAAICPYKKRWEVEWLESSNISTLNPNLNKLFTSSHGISKATDYADYILQTIYDYYHWQRKSTVVFRVSRDGQIRAKEYADFIRQVDILAETFTDKPVSVKSNINSPGEIIISIGELLSESRLLFLLYFALLADIEVGNTKVKA